MVTVLGILVLVVSQPAIAGVQSSLPTAQPVRFARAEVWKIQRVANPPDDREARDRKSIVVRGKRVTFRPSPGFENVDALTPGSDGSILVRRSHTQLNWSTGYFIWYRGKETSVYGATVDVYRDRLHFAGNVVEDTSATGMPMSAPKAYCIDGGKRRSLGWGDVKYWGRDGMFVLEVPVDEKLNPSGYEFTTGSVTRIVTPKAEAAFPAFQFGGRLRDGSVLLVSGSGDSGSGNGYVYLNKKADPNVQTLLLWKSGRVVSHMALPKHWTYVGPSPDGWLLVRRERPIKSPLDGIENPTPDQIEKAMIAGEETGEDDWTMGALRGELLTPIKFPRPKGTKKLLWRNGEEVFGHGAFRFHVFYGNDDRTYRLSRN